MKRSTVSLLVVIAVGGAFLAGSWHREYRGIKPGPPAAGDIVHAVASIHAVQGPAAPGVASASVLPSGPAHVHGPDAGPSAAALSPGRVSLSDAKQQLLGVRVSAVEKASGTHALRVLGRVAPDETRVYKVNAGVEGFIRQVSAVTTGSQVKKDQLLATFSAPASLSTIQLYILNLGAVDRLRQAAAAGSVEAQAAPAGASNVQQRIDQMQNLGVSVLQMEEIARTRQVPESIKMLAPADGFVLARNVSPGLKFEKGAEFFRIADLSRVWIVADVFEHEAHYLRAGTRARVTLAGQPGTLAARVAEVLPQFDAATRTLKVRLETDNPGFVLRPDMFVNVEVPVTLPPAIAVPVDAVVDAGLTRTVFVDRGEGVFEPRPVQTGWRFGNRVEIVEGLAPGERIVVSDTFLIDSESRMRAAAASGSGRATALRAEGGHQPAHVHGGH